MGKFMAGVHRLVRWMGCTRATVVRGWLLLALVAAPTGAAGEQSVRDQLEASTLVVGTGTVNPDGRLESYTLQPYLPSEIRRLVEAHLAGYELEVAEEGITPPAPIDVVMSLQVVARQHAPGDVRLSVADSLFQVRGLARQLVFRNKPDLKYPDAADANYTGIVYLALRTDANGRVVESHVERVNLTGVGTERQIRRGRDILAKSTSSQAKEWVFDIAPERVARPGPISLRVAVEYKDAKPGIPSQAAQRDIAWQQYVPGPYSPAPWDPTPVNELGAMVPGWIFPKGSILKTREKR